MFFFLFNVIKFTFFFIFLMYILILAIKYILELRRYFDNDFLLLFVWFFYDYIEFVLLCFYRTPLFNEIKDFLLLFSIRINDVIHFFMCLCLFLVINIYKLKQTHKVFIHLNFLALCFCKQYFSFGDVVFCWFLDVFVLKFLMFFKGFLIEPFIIYAIMCKRKLVYYFFVFDAYIRQLLPKIFFQFCILFYVCYDFFLPYFLILLDIFLFFIFKTIKPLFLFFKHLLTCYFFLLGFFTLFLNIIFYFASIFLIFNSFFFFVSKFLLHSYLDFILLEKIRFYSNFFFFFFF